MTNKQETIQFEFEEIDLDQLATLIPVSYKSKYDAMRHAIIARIKAMPAGKSFVFKPQSDSTVELTDDLIARLISGFNSALKKEGLNWRVVYAPEHLCFVVNTYKPRIYKDRKPKPAQVKPPAMKQTSFTDDEQSRISQLLDIIYSKSGLKLDDLKVETMDEAVKDVKRAFLYVGRYALGIKLTRLAEMINVKPGYMTQMCQLGMTKPGAKNYVDVIMQTINAVGQ